MLSIFKITNATKSDGKKQAEFHLEQKYAKILSSTEIK